MLKYETGPFKKPAGLLLSQPSKRITKKSKFLKRIERRVWANVEARIRAAYDDFCEEQAAAHYGETDGEPVEEAQKAAAELTREQDYQVAYEYLRDHDRLPPADYNDAPLAPPIPL